MRFRDFINKIVFKFLSFRNERGRQFYLSVFILILTAVIILSFLAIRQSLDSKVKENILKAVQTSNSNSDNKPGSKNLSTQNQDYAAE